MSLPLAVLDVWQHAPQSTELSFVLPDGCCDLIWHRDAVGRSSWFVTQLYDVMSPLEVAVGEHFCGYRLRPGTTVDESVLLSVLQLHADPDSVDVLSLLAECTHLDTALTEALGGLANAVSVTDAIRQLGVSERSLERLVMRQTGRTPGYWKQLARIRRAARALSGPATLADIAAENGFSDQAQMCRDFRRWFHITPSAFRRDSSLLRQVTAPGFD